MADTFYATLELKSIRIDLSLPQRPPTVAPWEKYTRSARRLGREKSKRAGNAGKGKERKEASARFCAVLWQDLRFCGFG